MVSGHFFFSDVSIYLRGILRRIYRCLDGLRSISHKKNQYLDELPRSWGSRPDFWKGCGGCSGRFPESEKCCSRGSGRFPEPEKIRGGIAEVFQNPKNFAEYPRELVLNPKNFAAYPAEHFQTSRKVVGYPPENFWGILFLNREWSDSLFHREKP